MWQDYLFAVGSFVLILGLVPAIFHDEKPPAKTSIVTGLVLALFGVAYLTLDLYYAAATAFGTTLCWGILAVQKLKGFKFPTPHIHAWRAYEVMNGHYTHRSGAKGGDGANIKFRCTDPECGHIKMETYNGHWTLAELNGEIDV